MLPLIFLAASTLSSAATTTIAPRPHPAAAVDIPAEYVGCNNGTPSGCTATNFLINQPGKALIGAFRPNGTPHPDRIQYVAPDPDQPTRMFWAAYSTRVNLVGARKANTNMAVFELACSESDRADILIFGTGYGCQVAPNGWPAEYDPATDAESVNRIVRNCMGITGPVRVSIVAPHGHGDHINPEFVHTLFNPSLFNFQLEKIYVHNDDLLAAKNMTETTVNEDCDGIDSFSQTEKDTLFVGFGGEDQCSVQTANDCQMAWAPGAVYFNTTLGRVWFRSRDGHTAGAVDLVLDYDGDVTNRYYIQGSAKSGLPKNAENCCHPAAIPACPTPLSDVEWELPAHGNLTDLDAVH